VIAIDIDTITNLIYFPLIGRAGEVNVGQFCLLVRNYLIFDAIVVRSRS
jgi:hypothetical protein